MVIFSMVLFALGLLLLVIGMDEEKGFAFGIGLFIVIISFDICWVASFREGCEFEQKKQYVEQKDTFGNVYYAPKGETK